MSFQNKKFYHKVYTKNDQYITTWSSDVISDPCFKMIINSGQGEMLIKLARPLDDYGEDWDVKFNNKIETYILDKEQPNGLLIYSGYISDYQPTVSGNDQYVDVTAIGYVVELENTSFINSSNGNSAKVYLDEDPSDIIKDILLQYNAQQGKVVAGNIDKVGTFRDYTFNNISNFQAIDKARELCLDQGYWYWYVGCNNKLDLHVKSTVVNHTFIIGTHFTKIDAFKTIRDLHNSVNFIGGIPAGGVQLRQTYSDATSIATYGLKEYIMIDTRVTEPATAQSLAQGYLDMNKDPFVRATISLIDSKGDNEIGYDIESILPGQTCVIIDPKGNTGTQSYALNQPMIIQSVQYDFDTVTLELSIRPPWVAKRIQDIWRDLNKTTTNTAPIIPSNTGVIADAEISPTFGNQTIGGGSQPNISAFVGGTVLTSAFNIGATTLNVLDATLFPFGNLSSNPTFFVPPYRIQIDNEFFTVVRNNGSLSDATLTPSHSIVVTSAATENHTAGATVQMVFGYTGKDPNAHNIWGFIANRGYGLNCSYAMTVNLSSSINENITTFQINDSLRFPPTSVLNGVVPLYYYAQIESETVKVLNNKNNILTVLRGQNNTIAVAHSSGTAVTTINYAQSYIDLGNDRNRIDPSWEFSMHQANKIRFQDSYLSTILRLYGGNALAVGETRRFPAYNLYSGAIDCFAPFRLMTWDYKGNNNTGTTLTADVAEGDVQISVTATANIFTANYNYDIIINGEPMTVTGISGTTINVKRSTTPTAHLSGATVLLVSPENWPVSSANNNYNSEGFMYERLNFNTATLPTSTLRNDIRIYINSAWHSLNYT